MQLAQKWCARTEYTESTLQHVWERTNKTMQLRCYLYTNLNVAWRHGLLTQQTLPAMHINNNTQQLALLNNIPTLCLQTQTKTKRCLWPNIDHQQEIQSNLLVRCAALIDMSRLAFAFAQRNLLPQQVEKRFETGQMRANVPGILLCNFSDSAATQPRHTHHAPSSSGALLAQHGPLLAEAQSSA